MLMHADLDTIHAHVPHFAEYPDAATRTADVTLDATHVNKLALQLDTGTYWRLVSAGASPVWAQLGDRLLSGIIFPFSGSFDGSRPINAATGETDIRFALCDGGTYTSPDGRSVTTPDLRDRFVLGATIANVGTTGGSWAHSHTTTVNATTLGIGQIPAHSHSGTFQHARRDDYLGKPGYAEDRIGQDAYSNNAGGGGSHTHGATTSTTSVSPPYYRLAYIMAL